MSKIVNVVGVVRSDKAPRVTSMVAALSALHSGSYEGLLNTVFGNCHHQYKHGDVSPLLESARYIGGLLDSVASVAKEKPTTKAFALVLAERAAPLAGAQVAKGVGKVSAGLALVDLAKAQVALLELAEISGKQDSAGLVSLYALVATASAIALDHAPSVLTHSVALTTAREAIEAARTIKSEVASVKAKATKDAKASDEVAKLAAQKLKDDASREANIALAESAASLKSEAAVLAVKVSEATTALEVSEAGKIAATALAASAVAEARSLKAQATQDRALAKKTEAQAKYDAAQTLKTSLAAATATATVLATAKATAESQAVIASGFVAFLSSDADLNALALAIANSPIGAARLAELAKMVSALTVVPMDQIALIA